MTVTRHTDATAREAARLADQAAYETFAPPPAPSDEEVAREAEACARCQAEEPRGAFCSSVRHRTHWARVRGARKAAALALVADAEADEQPAPRRRWPTVRGACMVCGSTDVEPGVVNWQGFLPGVTVSGQCCWACTAGVESYGYDLVGYVSSRLRLPRDLVEAADFWILYVCGERGAGRPDPVPSEGRWGWVDVEARRAAAGALPEPPPEPVPDAEPAARRRLRWPGRR